MKKIGCLLLVVSICILQIFPVCAWGEPAQTTYRATIYDTDGEGLALKSAPDVNSTRYILIPENTEIEIGETVNGWGSTSYAGYTGWVYLRYTKITDAPKVPALDASVPRQYYEVYNTEGEGLELRALPTPDSSTFGPLYDGTVITITDAKDGWGHGYFNGNYGWLYMGYLKESPGPATDALFIDVSQYVEGSIQAVAATYINKLYEEQYNIVRCQNQNNRNLICLRDITKDGLPELFYVKVNEMMQNGLDADEKVYTYKDGGLKELKFNVLNPMRLPGELPTYDTLKYSAMVAGNLAPTIFTVKDSDNVFIYTGGGDEWRSDLFEEFCYDGDVFYDVDEFEVYGRPGAVINQTLNYNYDYLSYDQDISESEFLERRDRLVNNIDEVLISPLNEFYGYEQQAISFDEAIEYLMGCIEGGVVLPR